MELPSNLVGGVSSTWIGASFPLLAPQAMEVSQEVSSMVRGWLMASPSAGKRKQPPDYVPISPRPERCVILSGRRRIGTHGSVLSKYSSYLTCRVLTRGSLISMVVVFVTISINDSTLASVCYTVMVRVWLGLGQGWYK